MGKLRRQDSGQNAAQNAARREAQKPAQNAPRREARNAAQNAPQKSAQKPAQNAPRRNYRFIVSYDGTRYLGWEHQPDTEMTIQGKLEAVLTRMLEEEAAESIGETAAVPETSGTDRPAQGIQTVTVIGAPSREEKTPDVPAKPGTFRPAHSVNIVTVIGAPSREEKTPDVPETSGTCRPAHSVNIVTVIGAGRTDAGVHARAMTANALLSTRRTPPEIQRYMNRYLPDDISVNDVAQAADRFHSRYNASGKTYRYTLWYDPAGSGPVFDRRYVTVLKPEAGMPDLTGMRKAAEHLTGEHDFRSFCGNSHMKKSTVRTVDSIRIEESGHYIRIYCHGDGFLQNMVRILCGTLLEVGYGRLAPEDMDRILEARDRRQAGPTLPPGGLCLMKVDYN